MCVCTHARVRVQICVCVHACVLISGIVSETAWCFGLTLFILSSRWVMRGQRKGQGQSPDSIRHCVFTALAKTEILTWFPEKFK